MAKNQLRIDVDLPPEALARVEALKEKIQRAMELSLNEYQRRSMRTATPIPADYPDATWLFQVSGFGLGIAGEAGEVADYLKKVIHHEHPLDREKVKKELGDVLWYIQGIAARCGLTLEEVAQANIDKLQARYPNGWTVEDSINRAQDE